MKDIDTVVIVQENATSIVFVDYQRFMALKIMFVHDSFRQTIVTCWKPEYGFVPIER